MDWVLWVQSYHSVFLDYVTHFLDVVGSNLAYLVILPLIYWSINRHLGRRLLFVLILAGVVTASLKVFFARPRPYQLHPDLVRALIETKSYGFPSGHVAIATSVWTFIVLHQRRWWPYLLVALYLLSMSWARMYSGVHYPHDILGGMLIAVLAVVVGWTFMDRLRTFWNRYVPAPMEVLLFAAIGIGAAVASQGEVTGLAAAGGALGGGLGLAAEERWVNFSAAGPWHNRILRFVLGLLLTGSFFFLLNFAVTPLDQSFLRRTLETIQYAGSVFIVLCVWPWLSIYFGLAHHDTEAPDPDPQYDEDIVVTEQTRA